MRKILLLIILIFCAALFAATPLLAAPGSDGSGRATATEEDKSLLDENDKLTVEELYKKVKEQREKLLENRLEVVKQANDAKARVEDLIARNADAKGQAKLAEALKKDLEVIKDANKTLNTILSDILTATAEGEEESGGQVAGYKAVTSAKEIMPSREYLNKLALLYKEKSFQLAKVIESLSNVGAAEDSPGK